MEPADRSIDIQTDPVSEIHCSNCNSTIDVEGIDHFVKVECPECHSMETVPARLGQFLLYELIGSGGMGGVFRALDETLGRMVAIKVMLKSYGDDLDFVEKFKREAQATAKLNHPNIVQIYSFGQEKGQLYIVMEFIGGKRFDKMVEAGQPINPPMVMKIGIDAARGLSAAEEAGLIHGDVKPENILLDEKMQAKIVDFGIASVANEQESGGIWGTPYYIAPEKVKRHKIDSRADIYSLGATMYHALAGQPPFEGKTPIEVVKARFEQVPPDLQKVSSRVTRKTAEIISRMLQIEPARRYPTYASAISDMRKALREMGDDRSLGGRKKVKTVVRRRGSAGPGKGSLQAQTKKNVAKLSTETTGRNGEHTPTGDALAEYRQRALNGGRASRKKRGKRVGSRAFLWFILVIIVLGAAGGGAAYFITKRQRTIRVRREFIALDMAKDASAKTFSGIAASATNLNKLADKAAERISTATNAAVYVTGEPITIARPLPLEPEEKTEGEDETTEDPVQKDIDEEKAAEAGGEETEEPGKSEQPDEPEGPPVPRDVLPGRPG
ncbi:MAG: protein kinase domain-containing protein, partial [Verrucomicrobiota bacterium]